MPTASRKLVRQHHQLPVSSEAIYGALATMADRSLSSVLFVGRIGRQFFFGDMGKAGPTLEGEILLGELLFDRLEPLAGSRGTLNTWAAGTTKDDLFCQPLRQVCAIGSSKRSHPVARAVAEAVAGVVGWPVLRLWIRLGTGGDAAADAASAA